MITNRRILLVFLLLVVLSGCARQDCDNREVLYYDKVPVYGSVESVQSEEYTYEQPIVETSCGRDFNYEVTYEEQFWLYEPVLGKPNQLKRTAYVVSNEDSIGEFSFDIVYLVDGIEVDRSKNPVETLVDPEEARRLFLVWNTEYSPDKEVAIDMIDVPRFTGPESCVRTVIYENKTGLKNKTVTSETVKYENIIKSRALNICD